MDRSWTTDLIWILLASALVALNGFFVAAEFALVKVRPARLAQRVRKGGSLASQALWLAERMDRSLSACQLGITVASLGLGWVGEPAIARLLEPAFRSLGIEEPSVIHGVSFAVAFTVITAAHLVLGEQAPKIFALRRPERLAIWCAVPLKTFYVLSYPLLLSLDAATSALLRLVGVPVRDLVELMGREVETGPVDTTAGLIMDRLGRVPRQGDREVVDGVTLEVLEARNHHATRIRVTREDSPSASG